METIELGNKVKHRLTGFTGIVTSRHEWHSLHGIPGFPFSQFMALARIRATEVLPTPLDPLKR